MKVLFANTVPAEVTVTAPRAAVLPTAWLKVISPAPAVNPRLCAPFSVLLKVILSPASKPVVMVMPFCRVTARRKEMPELPAVVLLILPPKVFNPAPS